MWCRGREMRRYELSDYQWGLIADLFPPEQGRGRPYRSHRLMANGMLWILNSGSPWRDLPERFGPWKTVYNRFSRWRREGVFDRIWSTSRSGSTNRAASIGICGVWTEVTSARTYRLPVGEKKG